MSRNLPNAAEMGRRGNKALIERYGSNHMSELAKKRQQQILKEDPDYYRRLAAAGLHAREVKKQARIKKEIEENRSVIDILTGK